MKQKPWKAYLWATLPTIAGGVLAGILSGSGGNYENYIKPPLSPPGWLFPVVWAVLYLLMAIGMAMVWNADQAHAKPARNLYIVQLVVLLLPVGDVGLCGDLAAASHCTGDGHGFAV